LALIGTAIVAFCVLFVFALLREASCYEQERRKMWEGVSQRLGGELVGFPLALRHVLKIANLRGTVLEPVLRLYDERATYYLFDVFRVSSNSSAKPERVVTACVTRIKDVVLLTNAVVTPLGNGRCSVVFRTKHRNSEDWFLEVLSSVLNENDGPVTYQAQLVGGYVLVYTHNGEANVPEQIEKLFGTVAELAKTAQDKAGASNRCV